MSYDYLIVRLRSPAENLNDLSPEHCVAEEWLDEGLALLQKRLPELAWGTRSGATSGDGTHLGTGRLEVSVVRSVGVTQAWVNGSHHADSLPYARRVAEAVGGVAFDAQTGKRVG